MKEIRRMAISFQNNPALLYILCSSICRHLCNCGNVYECVRSSSWWKVGGSSQQQTGKVCFWRTIAVNIVYSKIQGRTLWLSGNSSSFHSWPFPMGVTRKLLKFFVSRPSCSNQLPLGKNLLHASEVLYTPSISVSWLKHKDGFANSRGVEVKL